MKKYEFPDREINSLHYKKKIKMKKKFKDKICTNMNRINIIFNKTNMKKIRKENSKQNFSTIDSIKNSDTVGLIKRILQENYNSIKDKKEKIDQLLDLNLPSIYNYERLLKYKSIENHKRISDMYKNDPLRNDTLERFEEELNDINSDKYYKTILCLQSLIKDKGFQLIKNKKYINYKN